MTNPPFTPLMGLDALREMLNRRMAGSRQADGYRAVRTLIERGLIWSPVADVRSLGSEVVIKVELPGLTTENVLMECKGQELWIYGERPMHECEEAQGGQSGAQSGGPGHGSDGGVYESLERPCGPFARQFTLPRSADLSDVRAVLKHGLLTVRVPLADPRDQTRRIAIDLG